MNFNKVIVAGRLTADPELKATNNGKSVTNFTLAVNRKIGEETDFLPVVAWGKCAEFVCGNFKKGNSMLIDGELQTRKWQDKEGMNRTAYEINAFNIYFTEYMKKDEKKEDFNYEAANEFVEIKDDEPLPF